VNVNNEFVVSIPIEETWKAMLDLERGSRLMHKDAINCTWCSPLLNVLPAK
jgi:hypothetical protein